MNIFIEDEGMLNKKSEIIESIILLSSIHIVRKLEREQNVKFPGNPRVGTIDRDKVFIYFDKSNEVLISNIGELENTILKLYSK